MVSSLFTPLTASLNTPAVIKTRMQFAAVAIFKKKVMKKYIVMALMAIGSVYTPAFAQNQPQTKKEDREQKRADEQQRELNNTRDKEAKKQDKLDKKNRKMHKKQRKVNKEQRSVDRQTDRKG